jgi:ADP-ribosyl-[dinitrogen reductase] hydrolase
MFYASSPDALHQAFAGSLAADSLAMPVHWYYDRTRLRSDYGLVDRYLAPLPQHPGSILHRSHYTPLNEKGDILREQAQFWGQSGIHYHQFLRAGDNTLNYQLARRLHALVSQAGGYDPAAWLECYIQFMLTPGQHADTYLEEYHRAFFTNYARGKKPAACGIDDNHIGGLAQVPALLAALPPTDEKTQRDIVKQHVALTHKNSGVLQAADTLVRLLHAIAQGQPLRLAIESLASNYFSVRKATTWSTQPDEIIVGRVFSPACYINDAFPAALYLAWKHAGDFSAGIIANTMCGGDNCHRGAVTGSLLGAAHGVPARWTAGLLTQPPSPAVPATG